MAATDNDPNYGVSDSACQSVRDLIISTGLKLVGQQGHYLWGGEGEIPSNSGRCTFSTIALTSAEPNYPTFNAAQINDCACAGRPRHSDLNGRKPAAGSRTTTAQDPAV